MGNPRYRRGFAVTLHEDLIDLPRRWQRPRMVFVNSMSDLFHEEVPLEFIQQVFATMKACPHHTFQVLTKRAERLHEVAKSLAWAPNIWLGVTIEDESVTWRLDILRHIPASIKFLSCEPLLGPLPSLSLAGIDWVIVGGESGPSARPMDPTWAREIRDMCRNAGVPFFFKQWGGPRRCRAGRELDGAIYDEFPQYHERFKYRRAQSSPLASPSPVRSHISPLAAP